MRGEGAQFRLELGNGVACGGGEGLLEHRCLVEDIDGCFRVGDPVAERDDDVVDARRGRVGKGSGGEESVDLGADVLALESGGGVGRFEGGDTGLEAADGAQDLVVGGAGDRRWSWSRGH